MKPQLFTRHGRLHVFSILFAVGCFLGPQGGCQYLSSRSQEHDLTQLVDMESNVELVGDLTSASGLKYLPVEAISAVVQLPGTGSDPAPSARRDALVRKLQKWDVSKPNQFLAHPSTSLVIVRTFLPPGVEKGDPLDVEVLTPPRSETTNLAGGILWRTRLTEVQNLGGRIHTGHEYAKAAGPILPDSLFKSNNNPRNASRGIIPGGGIATQSRKLGLVLYGEGDSMAVMVKTAKNISNAINRRFHTFENGIKRGVTKPVRDNYIELIVHQKYKQNLARYMRVIASVPVHETEAQLAIRLKALHSQLLEPASSGLAALRLEAIGHEAVPILMEGLASNKDEVRFYSAEALAYLDEGAAAPVLRELAYKEPAFRWHALTGLSVMDDMIAHDELLELLNANSDETRYGAFRALSARDSRDSIVTGKRMKSLFTYHRVATTAEPLIHVTRSRRAEIVLFGPNLRIQMPLTISRPSGVVVTSQGINRLKVNLSKPRRDDGTSECNNRVEDLIYALVEVGCSYPEVVDVLRECERKELIHCRIKVDSMPQSGRTYERPQDDTRPEIKVASPMPSLFAASGGDRRDFDTDGDSNVDDDPAVGTGVDEEAEAARLAARAQRIERLRLQKEGVDESSWWTPNLFNR